MLDLLQPFTERLEKNEIHLPQLRQVKSDPKHEVVEEHSLDEKLPSVATHAGRNTLAKDTKSK